jgi:hypothetical protein
MPIIAKSRRQSTDPLNVVHSQTPIQRHQHFTLIEAFKKKFPIIFILGNPRYNATPLATICRKSLLT